jgi:hypothetical protein
MLFIFKKAKQWYKNCALFHNKIINVMRTIIITIATLFLVTVISAQEIKKDTLSKKEIRALKKQKKEAELKIMYDSISQVIDSRQFVLEADFLNNLKGNRINVVSSLNFIEVDSAYAVLQIGSNRGMGYNGVGGITAEGKLTGWKLEKDEIKKSFFLKLNVMTNIGIYDVFMNIEADGNAIATVSGLRPGRLQFEGKIVSLNESTVFKGHTP